MCVLSKLYSPKTTNKTIHQTTSTIRKTNNQSKKKSNECVICFSENTNENTFITKCEHAFCNKCITQWLISKNTCPLCRESLTKNQEQNQEQEEEEEDNSFGIDVYHFEDEIIPNNVVHQCVDNTLELMRSIYSNEENAPPPLARWKKQKARVSNGYRTSEYMYTNTITYEKTKYITQVRTITTRDLRLQYVYINIEILSHYKHQLRKSKHDKIKFQVSKSKKQKQYTNTAQTKQRYNHH